MVCGLLSVNPLLKLKENIKIGMSVRVARRAGTKDGIVTEIIDQDNYNEKGIEVEIDHYCIGNAIEDLSSPEATSVKEIIDSFYLSLYLAFFFLNFTSVICNHFY